MLQCTMYVGSETTVTMSGQMKWLHCVNDKRYPVKKFLSRELSDLKASPSFVYHLGTNIPQWMYPELTLYVRRCSIFWT